MRLRLDASSPVAGKERFWLGAVRLESAAAQYELRWVHGRTENLTQHLWQIEEEKEEEDLWSRKCLFSFVAKRIDKMLLHLADCEDRRLFDRVICEKTTPRHECADDADCDEAAECIEGRCLCDHGLTGDGRLCFDVNECQELSLPQEIQAHDCIKGQICRNSRGSYACSGCDHRLIQKGPHCVPRLPICTVQNCLAIPGGQCVPVGDTYTCGCIRQFHTRQFACLTDVGKNGASTYEINPIVENWHQARVTCWLEGGDLAVFPDRERWERLDKTIQGMSQMMFTLLRKMVFTYDAWVGGRREESGDDLEWLNGLPIQMPKNRRRANPLNDRMGSWSNHSLGFARVRRLSSYANYGSSDGVVRPVKGPAACLLIQIGRVSG